MHQGLFIISSVAVLSRAWASSADALPPTGAIYERTLRLPVLGTQSLRLEVLTQSRAVISLSGPITVREGLDYGVTEAGELFFTLGQRVRRMLQRLGVTMGRAEYLPHSDTALVNVHPPLLRALRISLFRVKASPMPHALALF